MFTSFSAALTGLDAAQIGVDTVGTNLANLDTTGYKAATVSFYDLVAQNLGLGNGSSVGLGTGQPQVTTEFTQGAIQTTGGALDGAIQGDGFFVVQDPSTGATEYTRAGNFQVDAAGNLMTATGQFVQGWSSTAGGTLNTSGTIGNITIPSGALQPPVATANMSMSLNLNAAATVGGTDGTFTTPISVYDSLGNSHVLTLTFTETAANTWTYGVTIPGADVKAGTAGTPFAIPNATGTLTFDGNGNLTAPTAANNPIAIKITGLTDGASDQTVNWSLYNPDGTPNITQFATPTAVASETQDGQAAAQLTHISMSNGGEILAQFSNGQQLAVGQLALASIRNPNSLTSVGDNNFEVSANTAIPAVGVPNTGGRGNILAGSLESSTVDIAQEFTNLITFQRSYEASAKVITTTDTLTQDTINLIQA